MTFHDAETSLAEGRPFRLYQFSLGSIAWRYTSGDRSVTHGGHVFRALEGGIIDDGIRQTGQTGPDQIVLTAPGGLEVAQLYRARPPSHEVALTMFDRHVDVDDYLMCWSGCVRCVKWPSLDRCEITCSPLSEAMTTTGLRLSWDRACPRVLYTPDCGVNKELWCESGLVDSLDGASVQVSAAALKGNAYYTAGYLEWEILGGAHIEQRGITSHAGATLTLFGGTSGIAPGTPVKIYRGCNQTTDCCKSFNNLPRFGGFPHMPGSSPFDGRVLY